MAPRWIWTEADFEQMGWHDSALHGIGFDPDLHEVELDIDYILEWLREDGADGFEFLVVPATLVFHDVLDLKVRLGDCGPGIEILDLQRNAPARRDPDPPYDRWDPPTVPGAWRWRLAMASAAADGEITFIAAGFIMYIRQPPRRGGQRLDRSERGGVSFARDTPGTDAA